MPLREKDKRHFKRYRKKSSFKVNVNGRIFKAHIIDYSLDGIGAIIEDTPPIEKGSVVDVDSSAPHVQSKGKIVWAKKSAGGLMVGIKRLDFSKKGRLEDYSMADILIGLQRSGSTGVLHVKNKGVIKNVYIQSGDIIFSSSNRQGDSVGEYLLKTGVLTDEKFKVYSDAIKNSGKKEGAVLVELGYIQPQNLPEIVRSLSEDIILSLFGLNSGDFEFREYPLKPGEVISLKLSAANLIYRGIKRIREPQKMFDLLQITMDDVLRFSSDPLDLFQDITLDADDRRILSYIDGETSIKDIVLLSQLEDIETLKSVYALLSTRIIEVRMEKEGVAAEVSAEEVIEEQKVEINQEFIDRVEGIFNTCETLGYYGILGVKEWSPASEIKKAYYKAAKEFHPDRHFHLKSDDIREKLNTIFSYITTAYTMLSSPKKRAEYDRHLTRREASVESKETSAKSKFEEGRGEFRNGNYDESFQLFGQAVYLDNTVGAYHYYYGLSLIRLKRFKEAERALSRAVEHEPFNAEYIAELGAVFLRLGFPHRAKSTFERALKIDPSNKKATEGLENVQD